MSFSNADDTLMPARGSCKPGRRWSNWKAAPGLATAFIAWLNGCPGLRPPGTDPPIGQRVRGYRVQGRTPKEAKSILADAVEIQDAGASLLVLECIPAELAADISRNSISRSSALAQAAVPMHRCCASRHAGHDETAPKFVQNFMDGAPSIQAASKLLSMR